MYKKQQKIIDNRNKKRDAIVNILNEENMDEVDTLLKQARDEVKFYTIVKLKKR